MAWKITYSSDTLFPVCSPRGTWVSCSQMCVLPWLPTRCWGFLNNVEIDTGKGVSGCQNTRQFTGPVLSQIPDLLLVPINTRGQARNSHTLFSRDGSNALACHWHTGMTILTRTSQTHTSPCSLSRLQGGLTLCEPWWLLWEV